MTEKTKKVLFEFLRAILAALVSFVTAFLSSSCGTTRAVVTNRAEATTTTIKITTANPTTVETPSTAEVTFQK